MTAREVVLITGATGSIGTKLRRHFASLGLYTVRSLCINPKHEAGVCNADLSVYDDAWVRQFAGVDTVIHLAGDPSVAASWESVQRLNIDLTLNVFHAARHHQVRRIVYASSNWVMSGYRSGTQRLTTALPPWPVNPYGASKLFGERAGRALAEQDGISFIAFRIGYCQHAEGNRPGPHMLDGIWGQQMWLSDRDLCQGFERAVTVKGIRFAVLNLMSENPGMRWDIEETRRALGYAPEDGHVAVMNE